jgi:signal transduction histidine kinase
MIRGPAAIAAENAVLYTERAQSERLAAIGQMAAIIVHEIKNPIGIIKVSIGTIKKKLKASEPGFELATFIEQEVERMNTTIQKILSFARPQEPTLGRCDLNGVIEKTLTMIEPDLRTVGIGVVRELDPAIGTVSADTAQVQQVLLNLFLNARAAMAEGGELRVRTRGQQPGGQNGGGGQGAGAVEIVVQDTGVGMDEATRERLFTPFFSTRAGGTGLGLAIVKQILDEHRAAIQVESRPGEGSRFTLVFPR